jgi:hypothetical protein
MIDEFSRCANCGVLIVDPTTRVVHGAMAYCCPNCSESMEQAGSGSDPHVMDRHSAPRCARCETPIVDEATKEERGRKVYCCRNCAEAGPGPEERELITRASRS